MKDGVAMLEMALIQFTLQTAISKVTSLVQTKFLVPKCLLPIVYDIFILVFRFNNP